VTELDLPQKAQREEQHMSATDKFKNATDSAMGSAKEKVGDATGNEDLQAEGQVDKTTADAKQAGEKVKDVFK
jgi:uncharacterized protein YjbJ (UPF0337 family)